MLSQTRPAAVAGTWYPRTAGALGREVDGYLADVPDDRAPADVGALIAPHAGLMFSGPVAAHAYKAVAARPYDVAVLVGPSHFVAFDGVALYPGAAFDSPLGQARVDEAGADAMAAFDVIEPDAGPHEREHSLEMQLPFLKRVLPDVPIVPLLMGYQDRETIGALAEAMVAVFRTRRALLIASTDLSHYFDATTAESLDRRVQDCVPEVDADRFLAVFEQYPEGDRGRYVACGGGPAIAVMRAARLLGATAGRVLRYSHSGVISGDYDGVVGYMAAIFARPHSS
jgi:AmmeMemoRadiSam system protein B